MDAKELLSLKKEIEDAKSDISKLKGQKEYLEKQLLDEFQCKSIEDAEKQLGKFEKQIAKIESQIQQGVNELNEMYDFN